MSLCTELQQRAFFAAVVNCSFSEARSLYTQALEQEPDNAVLYAQRSCIHLQLRSYGAASADASKSIELDPQSAFAHLLQG